MEKVLLLSFILVSHLMQWWLLNNSNDIFKNNYKSTIIENKDNNKETALVNISNIKWYEKIWKLFKDFFRK